MTYFFQPVVESGDTGDIVAYPYGYPGGTAFYSGVADTGTDLWFREGMLPEPSGLLLIRFAFALLFWRPRPFRAK